MKSIKIIGTLVMVLLFIFIGCSKPTTTTPPKANVLKIKNNTSVNFSAMYIRVSGIGAGWGRNILGNVYPEYNDNPNSISNGQSYSINLPFDINTDNRYDIRLQQTSDGNGGTTYTQTNMALSAEQLIEINIVNLDNMIRVENNTGINFAAMYIRVSGSGSSWGRNILGNVYPEYNSNLSSLDSGYTRSVNLPLILNPSTTYDIRFQLTSDGNGGATLTRTNISLSANQLLSYSINDLDNVIRVENNTSINFAAMYIRVSGSGSSWGRNILGNIYPEYNSNLSRLDSGYTRSVNLPLILNPATTYDIRFQLTSDGNGGATLTRTNIPLTANQLLTYSVIDLDNMIRVENNTSINFAAMYIRVSGSGSSWGRNILGNVYPEYNSNPSTLETGYTRSVNLPLILNPATAYDIRFQLTSDGNGGATLTIRNISLSANQLLSYSINDLDNVIRIENNTGSNFTIAYIRETGSSSWGRNILGNVYPEYNSNPNTLETGYTYSINLPLILNSSMRYDVRLQTTNSGSTATKTNISLSSNQLIQYSSSDWD